MKTKKAISLLMVFFVCTSLSMAQGQGKGQGNQSKNKQDQKTETVTNKQQAQTDRGTQKEPQTQTQDQTTSREKNPRENQTVGTTSQEQTKEFKGKGHAYGRNKGDLSGREFGMLRSEEAKNKAKGKFDDADFRLNKQKERVSSMRQNVENAKASNEEKYKAGKITKKQYELNKEKIQEAENIVNSSEERVNREKQNVESARKEIK
jgi:colicin import membrane protein